MSSHEAPQDDSQSNFRLYIDASRSFPWPQASKPSKEATRIWSLSPAIQSTLRHLPASEQTEATKYFHIQDASRSISSYLLKHLSIMRGARVTWKNSTINQERETRNGKPYYAPGGIDFNVSHHGNYVVCVGTSTPGVNVGIDIAQVDMNRDGPRIRNEGFESFVSIFSDVLSESERADAVRVEQRQGVEAGLRHFYTVWACKEAYVKMTSDALMAPWLKELEFPSLRVPEVASGPGALWGQPVVTEVKLQGGKVDGVKIELVALDKDYIVATSVGHNSSLPDFELVQVDCAYGNLNCSRSSDGQKSVSYSFND